MKKILPLALLFFAFIGFSCKSPSAPAPTPGVEQFKVTYYYGDKSQSQYYYKGEKLKFIETPVMEGYVFKGWYSDEGLTDRVNEGIEVTENLFLYGRFDKIISSYSVKFLNDDGYPVENGEFADKTPGDEITIPETPDSVTNSGWTFKGWCTDKDGNSAYLNGETYTLSETDDLDRNGEIIFYALYKDPDEAEIEVESVSIQSGDFVLKLNETRKLEVGFVPSNADNKNVTWSVEGDAVSVSPDGLVTVLKEGEAVIRITSSNGKTDSVTVTVGNPLEKISVQSENSSSIAFVDTQVNLIVKKVFADGTSENITLPDSGLVLSVDPVAGATLNDFVFSASEPGAYKITATYGGLTGEYTITVVEKPEGGLGFTYPASGAFSPVDSNGDEAGFGWDDLIFEPGGRIDSDGNLEVAVYSKNAERILLEIYSTAYGEDAVYDYWMEKGSDNFWRAELDDVPAGTLYAFRVWGANWTFSEEWVRGNSSAGFVSDYDSIGSRFNPNKVLFDPYAREISHDKSNPAALGTYDNGMYGTGAEIYEGTERRNFDTGKYAPKSVVVVDNTYFGVKPQIPQQDAAIYEAHVRGLTKHSSSANLSSILNGIEGFENVMDIPLEYQGTYKGAGMMAPYLKALGINTIELLPVHESDNDANPDDAPGGNYWAYMTYGYFAPDRRYSYDKSYGGPTKEFKEMVKAFHDEGIEVYLDVVFNHSGEGGPWYNAEDNYNTAELTFMRGFDCSEYYCLTPSKVGDHWQSTGCGNNLRCDNQVVQDLILDSLTYWIDEMGVDGYRFDLAPVIGREFDSGSGDWYFNPNSQILSDISALGASKNAEMIAEAWDTRGDGYQVGKFPSGWGEWNGRFRDAIRGYVNTGNRGAVNDYINGDHNNFNDQGGPHKTVNFVVAHDGFTLADLCSYQGAGNALNGTLTWPFGPSDGGNGDQNTLGFLNWSGTEDEQKASKRQAARNYIALQMISRGVPMIVYGDEFSRTQNGNNNPYNIDSVATWNNYNMINTTSPHLVETGGGGAYHNNFGTFNNTGNVNGNFMFMNYMLNLRASEPAFRQTDYSVVYDFKKEDGVTTLTDGDRCVWIKINGSSVTGGSDYLVFSNMYTQKVDFTVPAPASGKKWVIIADTASWAEPNYNCWNPLTQDAYSGVYGVNAWSVVILKQVDQ